MEIDPRQSFRPVVPKSDPTPKAIVLPAISDYLKEIKELKAEIARRETDIQDQALLCGVQEIDEEINALKEKRAGIWMDSGISKISIDLQTARERLVGLVQEMGPRINSWTPDAISKTKEVFAYPGIKILRSATRKRIVLNKAFMDAFPLLASAIATFKLKDIDALVTTKKMSKKDAEDFIEVTTSYTYEMG